jgi:hypothetical protein
LKCPAIIGVEKDKQHNSECDADQEPENPVPDPIHAPKSVPPHDTHADSYDNEADKFFTGSGAVRGRYINT